MTLKIFNHYTYAPSKRMRIFLTSVAIVVSSVLLSFPLRALTADYYYNRTIQILDNKPISDDTIADYKEAIRLLEKAIEIAPARSAYYKALSDIYMRLGKWAEVMSFDNKQLAANALSHKEAFNNAVRYIKKAIELEPANPDYHLLLGKLYDEIGKDNKFSDNEFNRAVNAHPVNTLLRYSVASRYLLAGNNEKAIEHARALAKNDDSYIVHEPIRRTLLIESRPPQYLNMLYRSYLFTALEIVWRASNNDLALVKDIAPDNSDAEEVVQLFLEWKGIEE